MTLAGLAVSNIAWPSEEFESAASLLRSLNIAGMEIAPRTLFQSWETALAQVADVRQHLDAEGLTCPALQGILFDTSCMLFENDASRSQLAEHLDRVARLASVLGAKSCVFGAPRQRDIGVLEISAARATAIDFFRGVAPSFADRGVNLAIEANARIYGCNFLITTEEAADFVAEVDREGISLQIDTGTIFLENENPEVLSKAAVTASHAHVSEPHLQPPGLADLDHSPIADALSASGYEGWLSIEMRCTEGWRENIERAVTLLRNVYL